MVVLPGGEDGEEEGEGGRDNRSSEYVNVAAKVRYNLIGHKSQLTGIGMGYDGEVTSPFDFIRRRHVRYVDGRRRGGLVDGGEERRRGRSHLDDLGR